METSWWLQKGGKFRRGLLQTQGCPPPHRCGSPIPIPFHGFSPSVLSQKFNVEQRVKVGPLTPFSFVCVCVFFPFFLFQPYDFNALHWKIQIVMQNGEKFHSASAEQATDFLYVLFFNHSRWFYAKRKKKTFSFFDLFSFYVDLLFAAVADVCAFI